jgi:tRNA-specific 2-thiouridylase
MATAKELGAEALATGHYVRRVEGAAGPELWRGADDNKDQSYFLFATTPEQLSLLRFPLGDKSKSETRELATEFGLTVAFKPDSQDICFVPNGSYAGIVEKLRPDAARAGNIVHVDGRVLGRHEGIIHYTIGQRKGIGIGGGVEASGEALYVVAVDAARAEVTVGPKRVLARDIVRVSEVNWLGGAEINMRVEVKLRSAQPAVPATLSRDAATGRAVITLDEPLYGIAPGQACVFYSGARVLGGGWIDSAESSREAA